MPAFSCERSSCSVPPAAMSEVLRSVPSIVRLCVIVPLLTRQLPPDGRGHRCRRERELAQRQARAARSSRATVVVRGRGEQRDNAHTDAMIVNTAPAVLIASLSLLVKSGSDEPTLIARRTSGPLAVAPGPSALTPETFLTEVELRLQRRFRKLSSSSVGDSIVLRYVPQVVARVPSPSTSAFCFVTRKLSGGATSSNPCSRRRRAMPFDARPVSIVAASMRVSNAAAFAENFGSAASHSRRPGPGRVFVELELVGLLDRVDRGLASRRPAHSVHVRRTSHDDEISLRQQLGGRAFDRNHRDVDDVRETFLDRGGDVVRVAVHRFVDHDGSHGGLLSLGDESNVRPPPSGG